MTAAELAQVTAALARYERAKTDLDAQATEGIAGCAAAGPPVAAPSGE